MNTSLRAMSAPRLDELDALEFGASRTTTYTVECADPHRHDRAVRLLIERMYEWRGLTPVDTDLHTTRPDRITLVASDDSAIFGTITLGLDGKDGILADALYPDELRNLRQRGARLCELTRLAMDTHHNAKEVLGALLHLVYIHGRLLHGVTDVVIEVHPRHAGFYQRMIGFSYIGEERVCPRVSAPAVLLHLELAHMDEQIGLYGGTSDPSVRTLYPYFLSLGEQDAILRRLSAAH
ncbi:long-chain N-acyl amino acid synthase [Zoogloea sp.]|uniref:N-acyl amino acid synthase FeeM domain-containing protein n=1 Tax=Zoogloea sp. TaxID=49181 RepID=UPI0035AE6634